MLITSFPKILYAQKINRKYKQDALLISTSDLSTMSSQDVIDLLRYILNIYQIVAEIFKDGKVSTVELFRFATEIADGIGLVLTKGASALQTLLNLDDEEKQVIYSAFVDEFDLVNDNVEKQIENIVYIVLNFLQIIPFLGAFRFAAKFL